MKNPKTVVPASILALLAALALGACHRAADSAAESASLGSSEGVTALADEAPNADDGARDAGFLYGRVTLEDGTVYEGRLRFGGDEEALWSNYFNGVKTRNPWVEYADADALPKEQIRFLGITLKQETRNLARPFMARFGDIARIDGHDKKLTVTLRSGRTFELGRYSADDLADGLRVWDAKHGVVDIGEWKIRSIELLPAPGMEIRASEGASFGDASAPLHGTVHTRAGDFTGLIQWNRRAALGSDALLGNAGDGEMSVHFDAIRSIARRSTESALVTLVDGSEMVLSGTHDVGEGGGGIYVDDVRYGRVLVSWGALESVDFTPPPTVSGYADYAAGRPLEGTIVTRDGRRLSGRLVYDLDESETTETLDAPIGGIDYMLPFAQIARVELPRSGDGSAHRARVALRSGEVLALELWGDLSDTNAGMLVFATARGRATYVPWGDVARIELDATP